MGRLRKLKELSWVERTLLAKAFVLVASIRLALRFLPFRTIRPVLEQVTSGTGSRRHPAGAIVERIPWAVAAAAARARGATCLAQALAGQILLARYGEVSRLHIGVARDEGARVRAHAWLEHRGRVVIGSTSQGRWSWDDFLPLPGLDGPGRKRR